MKKLLILAYDFPPYVSVGGLRPYNWFRYLKEYGVEPVVVTRQWGNEHGNHLDYISAGWSDELVIEESEYGTILRSPFRPNLSNRIMLKYGDRKYRLLRKAISGFYEIAQYIYPTGPKSAVYLAAREYLKHNKVDAIIATGDPFVLFSYASKLSMEFGIPWIADYRDTWVQDKTRSKNGLIRNLNKYWERKHLKNVELITTVSSFIVKHLKKNLDRAKFEVLHNGFDPVSIEKGSLIPQNKEVFTISFAGTIYNWHPIESFLTELNHWVIKYPNKTLHLNFYGINNPDRIQKIIVKFNNRLSQHISIFPKLQNEELAQKLALANVFLLFNDYSILGTKIFTYLGLKRKIILCFENDSNALLLKSQFYNLNEFESESKQLQADLIRETNSGIVVKDPSHLQEVLGELWDEFSSNGQVACHSVGVVEKYSRKIQVEKLAEIVKQLKA
jgi:hypothetical protein